MKKPFMDIQDILKYLPHRQPFLLVDSVLEMEVGKSIVALKNVSFNEPFFAGHFPGQPIMPGVLIIEALAQAGAILAYKSTNTTPESGIIYLFAGVDEARFRRVVMPGDQLILTVTLLRSRRDIWKLEASATVDGEVACSASLLSAMRDTNRDR